MDLDEEQWLGMAMLSRLTTAAKAQLQLNKIRNDRLVAECGENYRKEEPFKDRVREGIKEYEAVDFVLAVEECEREAAKKEEK